MARATNFGLYSPRQGARWSETLALPNLPEPLGWRILIKLRDVADVTKGGILLPQQAVENMRAVLNVGQVVAVGPRAYKREDMSGAGNWIDPDDWVLIGKYAGARFLISGIEYRILNDDEVLARVPDPFAVHDAAKQAVY